MKFWEQLPIPGTRFFPLPPNFTIIVTFLYPQNPQYCAFSNMRQFLVSTSELMYTTNLNQIKRVWFQESKSSSQISYLCSRLCNSQLFMQRILLKQHFHGSHCVCNWLALNTIKMVVPIQTKCINVMLSWKWHHYTFFQPIHSVMTYHIPPHSKSKIYRKHTESSGYVTRMKMSEFRFVSKELMRGYYSTCICCWYYLLSLHENSQSAKALYINGMW